jgi:hypothetical protein
VNIELEEKIRDCFPNLFKEKDLPDTASLMCYGCEFDDGWYNIMYDACEKLKEYPISFSQAKQKFGSLRIYYSINEDVDDETLLKINNIIEYVEEKSENTCEICGRDGEIINIGGYLKALCNDHCH